MVGKRETLLKLPYLQNDMQKYGGSRNVCLRILLPMIAKGCVVKVKFGTEVNCNIVTKYMQYNNYFKLFKHHAILIHSMSMLHFRSHINAVGSIHIRWLAQYHRPTVTSILAGCLKNEEWRVGESKHFSFTPKHADQFWHPPGILQNMS